MNKGEATPQHRLRYMRVDDIEQVVAIDAISFDPPWTAESYDFEVRRSACSYMVVLEERTPIDTPSLWQNLNAQLRGDEVAMQSVVVGYGGLWKIQEEAHISTIATHPSWRKRGYGEVLLVGMMQRSYQLGARYIVLEVRVSNTVAQALYRKFGFEVTRIKPNYYHSNKEDAYEMRFDFGAHLALDALYEDVRARVSFEDVYSRTAHPRLGS